MILITACVTSLLYPVALAIYRLFFHPLRNFPGSKLAAATRLHEFYYNVVKDGQFVWEIERMHQKYGPIIRINPDELHINDPFFYNEIYAAPSSRREKYHEFSKGIVLPLSIVTTIDHDLHTLRRKALSNFFSRQSIRRMEPLIQDKVVQLIQKLADAHKEGHEADLSLIFYALTIDTISHYAYGTNYQTLDKTDYEKQIREALITGTSMFHLMRFLPIDTLWVTKVPQGLLEWISPAAAFVMAFKKNIRAQAIEALGGVKKPDTETVFTALMSPELPGAERCVERLEDEGSVLLQAGSETTGQALSVTIFYILRDREILCRAKKELTGVMPTPESRPTVAELQSLPYFSAVINEGFRLSFGMLSRLPRVAPNEVLRYKEWDIPAGTPVSESNHLIHTNPDLFPNPRSFDPERWIRAGDGRKYLESMLTNFSKGRRQCLGIYLAQAEVYITIAHLVRWVDMRLLDSRLECIEPWRDRLIILPKAGHYSVKVVVDGVEM
ncbi:cytochrome P450 [Aspergillus heteromorphus CBS 117.55]|uniref:Cytochrome P450 n=1 Tax=Aspergillus heteromorphus CBS 117.55 TaxID=1448321 RepID=A0A317VUX4_9EURO|nr:cytochrome P450 [Aspergillus heteromorphus CBS 117.55]PWY77409.1 cytochrome P450 [Aspergillus heteromorphus CBS 117.55]